MVAGSGLLQVQEVQRRPAADTHSTLRGWECCQEPGQHGLLETPGLTEPIRSQALACPKEVQGRLKGTALDKWLLSMVYTAGSQPGHWPRVRLSQGPRFNVLT